MESHEKRKHRRVEVRIPVGIYVKGRKKVFDAEITNISEGGAFIRCSSEVTVGDEVSLEIRFRGAKLIDGTVVPIEKLDFSVPDKMMQHSVVRWRQGDHGFGIQFSALGEETVTFLKKMLSYYELLNKAGVSFPD